LLSFGFWLAQFNRLTQIFLQNLLPLRCYLFFTAGIVLGIGIGGGEEHPGFSGIGILDKQHGVSFYPFNNYLQGVGVEHRLLSLPTGNEALQIGFDLSGAGLYRHAGRICAIKHCGVSNFEQTIAVQGNAGHFQITNPLHPRRKRGGSIERG
jgi:hypothetical protein